MTQRHKISYILWVLVFAFFAWAGYMEYLYTPPPPVPCRDGMTLAPKQRCYIEVER